MLPNPFPVARYRLEFETVRPIDLPEYAGSALRGVFGHALRRLACTTHLDDCRTCPQWRSCAYPAVFETPPPMDARRVYSAIPHPFVVEPPPWGIREHAPGTRLRFQLVLIGPALQQLPLVLRAWQAALAGGLGPAEGTAQHLQVALPGREDLVRPDASGRCPEHAAAVPLPAEDAAPAEVTLEFTTPLRLKRDGRPLRADALTAQDLLAALVRRIADLTELQLGQTTGWRFAALTQAAARVSAVTQLHWRDWTRVSQRQQQAMKLGGLVGRVTLRGDLRPFWPLLHLGQWLHLGGKASFGLGQYQLVAPPG